MFRIVTLTLLLAAAACTSGTRAAHARGGAEVQPIDDFGFFQDEQREAQAAVARWAESHGHAISPVDELEQAYALAAEGRSPAGGPVCGKPLSRWEARARWGGALGLRERVRTELDCRKDAGCTLSVEGTELLGDGRSTWTVEAPLAPGADGLKALADTLPALKPPTPQPERGAGGLGILGGLAGGPVKIRERDELRASAFGADRRAKAPTPPRDEALFPGLTPADLRRCDPSEVPSVGLRVQLGADGSLSRCEAGSPDDRSAGACLCERLASLSRAASSSLRGHRWSVSLGVVPRDVVTPDHAFVLSAYWNTHLLRVKEPAGRPRFKEKVADPSLEHWRPGSSRAAAECFADSLHDAGRVPSRWAVWFDDRGRATRAVQQKGYPLLATDVAACVEKVMLSSVSPCPAQAGLWAEAVLEVNARAVGASSTPLDALTPPGL